DLQVNVQPGCREVAAGLALTVTGDRTGRQGEPYPAVAAGTVADGGAVPRGPGLGGQRLDRLDELAGRDDLAAGQAQQLVSLAEDLAGRRDAGQLAAQRPVGQAPGEVAGGVARSEEHTSELQSLTNLVCR